ncbi:putative FAD dependent oxidoreductase [Naematelia encephala]|uniref:Putative FAD dependent oxidoreductase n=1 Tax=Naematelia encephala TaxID=71784 RepID=A0A1Y2AXR1_9TREE|nr:putative FAD dependent oxidoreductase [Naematelia encephala]
MLDGTNEGVLRPVGEEGNVNWRSDFDNAWAGLPIPDGMSLSHWLQTVRSNPLLDHRSTGELPEEVDVVVIGSGMSGSLAALSLLQSSEPPKSMVLLEARELCSGATGRNAGHCKPDQWRGYSSYAKRFGSEQALKILANEQQTWAGLVTYVLRHKVDCSLWVGKTLDVMMEDDVAKQASNIFTEYKNAGGDVSNIDVVTDPAEAEKVSRLKGAKALYAWDAATLHPWKLVAHIIQQCLDLGLNLQTWTPVTSVTGSAHQWTVHSERGAIKTPAVIYATNAYTGFLLPETKSIITPTPQMCNRVIPPSSFSGSKAIQNSYAVVYRDGLYSINPRVTSDGAILFGGDPSNQYLLHKYVAEDERRQTDDSLENFEAITDSVREVGRNAFQWDVSVVKGRGARAKYDYSWSGIMGITADGLPLIGAVPGKPGQWMSCGHNGHGMARIFTCSPGLARLIQGASWSETGLPECFQVTKERLGM